MACLEQVVESYVTHTNISDVFSRLVIELNRRLKDMRVAGSIAANAFSTFKSPDFDLCYNWDLRGKGRIEEALRFHPSQKGINFYHLRLEDEEEAMEHVRLELEKLTKTVFFDFDKLFLRKNGELFVHAAEIRRRVEDLCLSIGLPVNPTEANSAAVTMKLGPDYVCKYQSLFEHAADSMHLIRNYGLRLSNHKKLILDVDIVLEFTLSYDCLPEETKRWETRSNTGWPTPEMVAAVKKEGGRFVPKTNKSGDLALDMRLSLALDVILKHLPHYREVLVILKDLNETVLQNEGLLPNDKAINSFFFNTAMAWVREKSTVGDMKKHELLQKTLEFLAECYEAKHLPLYFDENTNLLEGMTDARLGAMHRKLVKLNNDLPEQIRVMAEKPMMGGTAIFNLLKTLFYLSCDGREAEQAEMMATTTCRQMAEQLPHQNGQKELYSVVFTGYLDYHLPKWLQEWTHCDVFNSHLMQQQQPMADFKQMSDLLFENLLPRLEIRLQADRMRQQQQDQHFETGFFGRIIEKSSMFFTGKNDYGASQMDMLATAEVCRNGSLKGLLAQVDGMNQLEQDDVSGQQEQQQQQLLQQEQEQQQQQQQQDTELSQGMTESLRELNIDPTKTPMLGSLLAHLERSNMDIAEVILGVLKEFAV